MQSLYQFETYLQAFVKVLDDFKFLRARLLEFLEMEFINLINSKIY